MKSEIDLLSDRHFRPDPLGVLAEGAVAKFGVVRVSIDADMASSRGGQHLAWMLVNLLSRQFKVVREILLDVPPARLLDAVAPFGAKDTLVDSLVECVRLVGGPHVGVRVDAGRDLADVSLGIGQVQRSGVEHWNLYADGWRYFVGVGSSPCQKPPLSGLTIGPYLCASLAAGEVFKLFRGMKPGKGERIGCHLASAWTLSTGSSWEALDEGPELDTFRRLPHFYFAGAGAVAQAAAVCLGNSGFQGQCTVIDRDALDLSNDNRYPLSNRENDKAEKAALLSNYLASHGFVAMSAADWWEGFSISKGRWAPDAETAALERAYKFPIVLSCVDRNEPRHAIQQALPQLIIGGSTDGLTAKASIVDLGLGTACLKCHNPIRSRNATVRQRIELLQTMSDEQRRAFCEAHEVDPETVARVLAPSACGRLSEGDLSRFAADSPEMSVGFVSVAAGVLTVVQLLRVIACGSEAALKPGSMVVATFARAGLRSLRVGRDQSCECDQTAVHRWRNVWGRSWERGFATHT